MSYGTGQLRAVALEPEKPCRCRVNKSVAYGKRVKVYPLPQAANPPPTVFGVKGSRKPNPNRATDVLYPTEAPA